MTMTDGADQITHIRVKTRDIRCSSGGGAANRSRRISSRTGEVTQTSLLVVRRRAIDEVEVEVERDAELRGLANDLPIKASAMRPTREVADALRDEIVVEPERAKLLRASGEHCEERVDVIA